MSDETRIHNLELEVERLKELLSRRAEPLQEAVRGGVYGDPVHTGFYRCYWVLRGRDDEPFKFYNYWTGNRWRGGNRHLELAKKNARWMDCDTEWELKYWFPLTKEEQAIADSMKGHPNGFGRG